MLWQWDQMQPRPMDLHPLWKGETLKKWLRDIFEHGSGGVFQKSLKRVLFLTNYFEQRVHLQTEFEKIPHPVGAWVLGPGPGPPGPWPPGGVFFQKQFETGPFFKIVWKSTPFFSNFFEKHHQTHFKNRPQGIFSKFHLLIRDANP